MDRKTRGQVKELMARKWACNSLGKSWLRRNASLSTRETYNRLNREQLNWLLNAVNHRLKIQRRYGDAPLIFHGVAWDQYGEARAAEIRREVPYEYVRELLNEYLNPDQGVTS